MSTLLLLFFFYYVFLFYIFTGEFCIPRMPINHPIFYYSFAIIIFLIKLIITCLYYSLGYMTEGGSQTLNYFNNEIDFFFFKFSVCFENLPILIVFSAIFKNIIFFLSFLLYNLGIDSNYIYIFIILYIIIKFVLSKDKLSFIINLVFIIIF